MELPNEHSFASPQLNGLASKSSSINELTLDENHSSLENSLNHEQESEVLKLSQLCRNFYKQRLVSVDNQTDLDLIQKHEAKNIILKSYIKQVEEQNDVLMSTLIELEKEAEKRVKQMEKRLKTSAKTTMEAVINIHECEREMRKLVEERLSMEYVLNNMQQQLSSLKVENSFLRDQNCNLNHDIQALLHVIHHARSTGHWEMNCVTFCEVTPEQIFGPVQSISHMYSNESPPSDFNLPEEEQKELNSDFSSQDASHSSRSSPSINDVLESTMVDCNTGVQLSSENYYKKNKAHVFPSTSPSADTSVQKCISLPDIGNIYSYTNIMRKSHSCHVTEYQQNTSVMSFRKRKICNKKYCHITAAEKTESELFKYTNMKHKRRTQKAQSEPHLFMFGDNVYVYRPCEPAKKESTVALCNDYQMSLPPCQSIDLKVSVEESNLMSYIPITYPKSSTPYGIPDSSYPKVDETSTSCSSNESVPDGNSDKSLCNTNSCLHIDPDMLVQSHSRCSSCFLEERLDSLCNSIDMLHMKRAKLSKLVSLAVQTENNVAVNSIGLQADICENTDKDLLSSNLFELDLSQLRRTIQSLKENIQKAEDKIEAKSMLIEQLQGHITSAVKEVELKDQALSNVEKKLETSRNECSNLRGKISTLELEIQQTLKDLDNLQMLNDNLHLKITAKEDKIEELLEEQKMLQNQKRALMTQLDAQGDLYEKSKEEFDKLRVKTDEYIVQLNLQNQTIQNLQEALVKTKRASGNMFTAVPSSTSLSSNFLSETKNSSRSSIMDI